MANVFQYMIRATDRSKAATDQAQGNMRDMGNTAQRVGNLLKGAFTVTAIVAAGRQIARISNDLQKAYAVQERAEKKLAHAVSASPLVDGTAVASLQQFASELQGITTIGDEVAIDLAAMAVTWGRNESEIRQLITASADLSEALGLDLQTAARGVNNLMEGNITTLSRYIPELRNLTEEQIASGEAMELLEQRFGGMAEAMRDTTEGSMKAFANAWGDLQEQLGRRAAERMTPIRNFFTGLIEDFTDSIEAIGDLKDALLDIQRVWTGAIDITQVANLERYIATLEQQEQNIQRDIQRIQQQLRGLDPRATQMREGLQGQMQERLTQLSLIGREMADAVNEQARREAEDAERAADARADKAVSEGRRHFQEVTEALNEQLGINQRMYSLWNDESDLQEANRRAVVGALNKLIELGYDVGGANIETVLRLYGEYLEQPAKEVEDSLDSLSSTAIQTEISFGTLRKHTATTAALMTGELIPATGAAALVLGELTLAGDELAKVIHTVETSFESFGQQLDAGETGQATGSLVSPTGATTGDAALQLAAVPEPIMLIAQAFAELLMQIDAVVTIMAPLKVFVEGILAVLGPVINDGLAPLIGILHYLGQMLGHFLLPIFEMWLPLIEMVANAFVWMYNSIFVPVQNKWRDLMNGMYNFFADFINSVIRIINDAIDAVNAILLPRHRISNIGYVSRRQPGHGHAQPIDVDDLRDAGSFGGGAGETGLAAQYTTGRDITINVEIYTDVIAGEGGIRDLALIIRDEIRSAEALGA